MKIYFEEIDLTSFGEYLLSNERSELIASNYKEGDSIPLEERKRTVYHSDYENWKNKN